MCIVKTITAAIKEKIFFIQGNYVYRNVV